jgi:hypothetical protein
MDSDALLKLINDLCETFGRARVTRTLAEYADTGHERAHLVAQAEYWDSTVSIQYRDIATAVHTALPQPLTPAAFMPVRLRSAGTVELHTTDSLGRPVVIPLTGEQSLALGVHLTAHAAVGLDRAGTKVAQALPRIPASAAMHSPTPTPTPTAAPTAIGVAQVAA